MVRTRPRDGLKAALRGQCQGIHCTRSRDVRAHAALLDGRAVGTKDELGRGPGEGGEAGDREVLVVERVVLGDDDLGLSCERVPVSRAFAFRIDLSWSA